MKNIYKILIILLWFITLIWFVYATVTTANTNKSSFIPWQWTASGFYDSANNVWSSNIPESRFTNNWDWTVSDSLTNLIWQSDWVTQWTFTWYNAIVYCDNLDLWWQIDWRLPNVKELSSIVDFSVSNPSIDTTYFSAISHVYWSSSVSKYRVDTWDNDISWTVLFTIGYARFQTNTLSYYVRCVRS